tara:strand:+ start:244 stop:627 length:384 start_codon:yes stop_codon:yes gene_type:complete
MPRKSKKTKKSKAESPDTNTQTPPETENGQQGKVDQESGQYSNIFVGKKPIMSYAMSSIIQLGQTGEIMIKARGMVISRAVDVAEIVVKRLGNNKYDVKNIKIDTEQLGEAGQVRNVSTIEILIAEK